MDETLAEKLARLRGLHEQRVDIQRKEEELAAELATSSVRGVRTAMASALGVSLEALRQRYGSVPSVTVPEPAEK